VLLEQGHEVRCLVRDASRARLPEGVRVIEGDVVQGPEPARGARRRRRSAYYLVHAMGRATARRPASPSATAAPPGNFGAPRATAAWPGRSTSAGSRRRRPSEHLRSRHEVAEVLRDLVPELVYVRAAMIIGQGSASFQILHHLVQRLPAMLHPRWVDTRSQPIAIRDVVHALATLATREDPPPRSSSAARTS
jgi:uncharacterized protein YbjT (DUF2867 family)